MTVGNASFLGSGVKTRNLYLNISIAKYYPGGFNLMESIPSFMALVVSELLNLQDHFEFCSNQFQKHKSSHDESSGEYKREKIVFFPENKIFFFLLKTNCFSRRETVSVF